MNCKFDNHPRCSPGKFQGSQFSRPAILVPVRRYATSHGSFHTYLRWHNDSFLRTHLNHSSHCQTHYRALILYRASATPWTGDFPLLPPQRVRHLGLLLFVKT
jgi:hypothetical protein